MATRNIVKLGDDTLRKVCKPQEKFDLRLWTLLKDMADTMYKAEGVGLAGPAGGHSSPRGGHRRGRRSGGAHQPEDRRSGGLPMRPRGLPEPPRPSGHRHPAS